MAQAREATCFDVSRGFGSASLYKSVYIFKDCNHHSAEFFTRNNDSLFMPMLSEIEKVNTNDQQCFFWLQFRLVNSSLQNQRIFYNAGSYASFEVYKLSKDDSYSVLATGKNKNYQIVDVASHDTIDLLVKHYFNSALVSPLFYPWLYDFYNNVEQNPDKYLLRDVDSFYYFMILFAGMTGMLAIYLLISFFHLFDRSYLYYSLNIFSIVALVAIRLVNKSDPSHDGRDLTILFSVMLQILSHLFYFLFASHFLNLKDFLPSLYRFFRYVVGFLVIYIIADVMLFLTGDCNNLRMQMFFWVRILLIIIAFGSIIYAYRKPTILLRLFTIGTFLMVFSATISFVLSYYTLIKGFGFLSIPFFYFLLGYLIDNLFFTIC
ncbi:MAG: 7TM diverse intracellular signaling domain-containing protein, partial [Bacteroidota bacterium]